MKTRTLKIILIVMMTLANLWFIGYLEDQSNTKSKQEWKSKIKIPSMVSFIVIMVLVAVFLAWPSKYIPKSSIYYDENRTPWYCFKPATECPHEGNKTLVTVQSAATCETVQTICDDCGGILETNIEC